MNSQRLMTAVTVCLLLGITVEFRGGELNAAPLPSRFGDLLHVGETVLLWPSSTQPYYLIQLLTPDQARKLQTDHTSYAALQEKRDQAEQRLGKAVDLDVRAKMFIEYRSLASAVRDISSAARMEMYAYKISHVGENFVTLKRNGTERFIPFNMVREMSRSDTIGPRARSSSRRSSAEFTLRQNPQIRLQHAPAGKVADLINEFFPDTEVKVVVLEQSNSLLISGDRASLDALKEFIDMLDREVPKSNAAAAPGDDAKL